MSLTAYKQLAVKIMAPGCVGCKGSTSLGATLTAKIICRSICAFYAFNKIGLKRHPSVKGVRKSRSYGIGGFTLLTADRTAVIIGGGTCAGRLACGVLVDLLGIAVLTGYVNRSLVAGDRNIIRNIFLQLQYTLDVGLADRCVIKHLKGYGKDIPA